MISSSYWPLFFQWESPDRFFHQCCGPSTKSRPSQFEYNGAIGQCVQILAHRLLFSEPVISPKNTFRQVRHDLPLVLGLLLGVMSRHMNCGCPVKSRGLALMVVVGPFQLRILNCSVIKWWYFYDQDASPVIFLSFMCLGTASRRICSIVFLGIRAGMILTDNQLTGLLLIS